MPIYLIKKYSVKYYSFFLISYFYYYIYIYRESHLYVCMYVCINDITWISTVAYLDIK